MNKSKKEKSHLPFRLNVLFFVIFLLFSLLILQLGVVQILYGDDAQEEIDRTENVISKTPVPRGEIYDRFGNVISNNSVEFAITYTPQKNAQPEDNLKIAEKLANFINMEDGYVTERDMKDFWILKNRTEAYDRLTDEEKEQLSDSEEYQLVLDRITEEDLNKITNQEREVIAIKRELDQAIQLTPHVIKNEEVTKEEYAVIAEHASELDGINVSVDWERDSVHSGTLGSLIGSLTTRDRGLPKEKLDFYLARNYSLNDRVGDSGLEEEYEIYLQGKKEIRQHITNSDGEVVSTKLIQEGERGKDLRLSIDLAMQKKLDQILQEEILIAKQDYPENKHLSKAMAVMMDPNTGEIIAISGQRYVKGNEETEPYFSNEAFRVMYDAHLPGSTVKGATVLAGLDTGVVTPQTQFQDHPLHFRGSPVMRSWTSGIGYVNDIAALKRSSNIYMIRTAMRLMGHWDYTPNESLRSNGEGYKTLSKYLRQLGLGVSTGVDYPYESTGVIGGKDTAPSEVLLMAYGQHENYTALQLVQYVSTLANGGYRMEPHLVKQIHYPVNENKLGPVYKVNEPKILNKVDVDQKYIERVQEGFRQVFQEPGGTAYSWFYDAPYQPAGKTGTAESLLRLEDGSFVETINLSLVGYAPHEQPEVAFAIIVPHLSTDKYHINNEIGRRMLDYYFKLKELREQGKTLEDIEKLESESEVQNENDEA